MLHAAQIAEPLLADRADECDRARRLNVLPVAARGRRQQHRQAATIVADARPAQHRSGTRGLCTSSVFRENRVEVGAEHEVRPCGEPGPFAKHVAGRVDPDVRQPEPLERLSERLRPGAPP